MRLRVFLPELNAFGSTSDISLYGCCIETNTRFDEGQLLDILIELPIIGPIPLKGYIQHNRGKNQGTGLQFVQVHFAQDQSDYLMLYRSFLKFISQLENIRAQYLEMAQNGKLELFNFPEG